MNEALHGVGDLAERDGAREESRPPEFLCQWIAALGGASNGDNRDAWFGEFAKLVASQVLPAKLENNHGRSQRFRSAERCQHSIDLDVSDRGETPFDQLGSQARTRPVFTVDDPYGGFGFRHKGSTSRLRGFESPSTSWPPCGARACIIPEHYKEGQNCFKFAPGTRAMRV